VISPGVADGDVVCPNTSGTSNVAAGKAILEKILPGVDPDAQVTLAKWDFAMFERNFDAAEQVLAEYPSEEFPPPMRDPKVYYRGCAALARGGRASAQTFFEKRARSSSCGCTIILTTRSFFSH
jgi:hypothetical protein